jgi:chromosome partitioning protein
VAGTDPPSTAASDLEPVPVVEMTTPVDVTPAPSASATEPAVAPAATPTESAPVGAGDSDVAHQVEGEQAATVPPSEGDEGAAGRAADEEEPPMVTTNPQPPPAVEEEPVAAREVEIVDEATEPVGAGEVPSAEPEVPAERRDPKAIEEEEPGTLPLPRVIAIANQKGGVGKTTTAVNLGAALAEVGYRVLVVDLDPQGNASTGLGISPRDVENSVYDVIMTDTPALDCVEPTSLKNLFVLPATIDLAGAEIELVAAFSRELKLRRALDPVRAEYDVILIDCPPSLGLLTVNGLAAADDVIVPVQSEYYALEGLGQLLKNVAMVRSVNPNLDVRGIVLTMHDSRTKLAEQVEIEVREHFGAKVYKTVVPRNVRLSEAPSFGQPIIVFDSTSRGAWAYRDLAKEVSGGATRRSG